MRFPFQIVYLPVLLCLMASTSQAGDVYFPAKQGVWETVDPKTVAWNRDGIEKALEYAGSQRSTGVVILHRGRIIEERYWKLTDEGSDWFNKLLRRNTAGHDIEDVASIQKSLVSILIGVAQDKGVLTLEDPVSQHLGEGWTHGTPEQERTIRIRHLLEMTSGLNEKLEVTSPPGTKW